jgi:hypothetical protein
LSPEGSTDRFIFRRFKGDALIREMEGNGNITSADVVTVALKINPQEMTTNEQKITNKVPTNAPERFMIFDWGNDLTVLHITEMTGQLLPSSITRQYDTSMKAVDGIMQQAAQKTAGMVRPLSEVTDVGIALNSLGYFQLIELSPKYRTFRRLYEEVYKPFDADKDVLTLEMGDYVYRCYFTNFSFTISSGSPWNWTYTIDLGIISNLSEKENRGDSSFTTDKGVIDIKN